MKYDGDSSQWTARESAFRTSVKGVADKCVVCGEKFLGSVEAELVIGARGGCQNMASSTVATRTE